VETEIASAKRSALLTHQSFYEPAQSPRSPLIDVLTLGGVEAKVATLAVRHLGSPPVFADGLLDKQNGRPMGGRGSRNLVDLWSLSGALVGGSG
jgi:hypothetical protein